MSMKTVVNLSQTPLLKETPLYTRRKYSSFPVPVIDAIFEWNIKFTVESEK